MTLAAIAMTSALFAPGEPGDDLPTLETAEPPPAAGETTGDGPAEGPASGPASGPAEAPEEIIVRTDPLDKEPEPEKKKKKAVPEPPPTTDHYGIPSRAAGKDEITKEPPPPQPPPSEEAAARDTEVGLSEEGEVYGGRKASRQRFALEFKMGPYLPAVDRRYEGAGFGPYATIFGRTDSLGNTNDKPKLGVMPVLGFEWQFLHVAGPLAIGTQVAFFRDTAKALLVEPDDDGNVRSAADDTAFGMVPLALLLSYRFEYMADKLRVPIVPYAKGGLAYAFWWTKDGNGNISRNSMGEKGSGGVAGWQVNAGAMIRLDFLEPNAAIRFDQISGINHTYIFGEYQLSRIANFGAGNSIALGDSTWFAGLAIEF